MFLSRLRKDGCAVLFSSPFRWVDRSLTRAKVQELCHVDGSSDVLCRAMCLCKRTYKGELRALSMPPLKWWKRLGYWSQRVDPREKGWVYETKRETCLSRAHLGQTLGMSDAAVAALLLYLPVAEGRLTLEQVSGKVGSETAELLKVSVFSGTVESRNIIPWAQTQTHESAAVDMIMSIIFMDMFSWRATIMMLVGVHGFFAPQVFLPQQDKEEDWYATVDAIDSFFDGYAEKHPGEEAEFLQIGYAMARYMFEYCSFYWRRSWGARPTSFPGDSEEMRMGLILELLEKMDLESSNEHAQDYLDWYARMRTNPNEYRAARSNFPVVLCH